MKYAGKKVSATIASPLSATTTRIRWSDSRQSGVPTSRAIKRRTLASEQTSLPDFAMRPDQLRRYRQIGSYEAYRVVFRNVPALTIGDGRTLGPTGRKLAQAVNESVRSSTPRTVEVLEHLIWHALRTSSWKRAAAEDRPTPSIFEAALTRSLRRRRRAVPRRLSRRALWRSSD